MSESIKKRLKLIKIAESLKKTVYNYFDENPELSMNIEIPSGEDIINYLQAIQIDIEQTSDSPVLMTKTAESIINTVKRNKRLLLD